MTAATIKIMTGTGIPETLCDPKKSRVSGWLVMSSPPLTRKASAFNISHIPRVTIKGGIPIREVNEPLAAPQPTPTSSMRGIIKYGDTGWPTMFTGRSTNWVISDRSAHVPGVRGVRRKTILARGVIGRSGVAPHESVFSPGLITRTRPGHRQMIGTTEILAVEAH